MLRLLILSLFAFSFSGCTMNNVMPGGYSVPKQRMTDKLTGTFTPGKLYVGAKKGLYHSLDSQKRFVRDKPLEDYANRILQKLKKMSSVDKLPGNLYFLANRYLNASVSANGNIFVNYGALTTLETEDEFAALIAHELAHVILQHHNSDSYLKYHRAALRLSVVANQAKTKLDQLTQSNKSENIVQLGHLYNAYVAADEVIFPIWNRGQEYEADLLAVEILNQAGYNPAELSNLFDKMQDARNNRIEEQKKEAELRIIAAQKVGFTEVFSVALKGMAENLKLIFGNKHPSPESRKQHLSEYYETFLLDFETQSRTSTWKRNTANYSVSRISNSIQHIHNARIALQASNLTSADQESRAAEKQLGGDSARLSYQPYSRMVRADVRKQQHKLNGQRANLVLATKSKYAPFETYLELYRLSPRNKSDFSRLRNKFKQYYNSPSHYPTMIKYASEAGLDEQAKQLKAECIESYGIDDYSCIFNNLDSTTDFKSFVKKFTP